MAYFIHDIAVLVQKYAPTYGICVYSPIIAQAVLESAQGTSELAIRAKNVFGLKYNPAQPNRCPSAIGYYVKDGSEQNPDGSYTSSTMLWQKFNNLEDCVIGYFDFINTSRYANLKGVTDPRTYLENIKADGYATSLQYVDNLIRVIETYNLTKYDKGVDIVSKELIVALDAGHGYNTLGKRCMKAIDPNQTREWWMNDRIIDKVERKLASYNAKIVRVDDTTGNTDVSLANRVKKANNANADVYISMHHNAGINGGNGGGTIVFYYSSKAVRATQAQDLYDLLVSETKLVGNRSDKVKKYAYYVIKNTNMPAFLVENGFMDSKTDVPIILTEEHAEKTANALVKFLERDFGLTKKVVAEPKEEPKEEYKGLYRVQVGAYGEKANAEAMQTKLKYAGFDSIIVKN